MNSHQNDHDGAGPKGDDRLDRLFDVLADERRHRMLVYLHVKDGDTATFGELVDYLVVLEAESLDDLEGDEVALEVCQTQLPKLAAAGYIEYDERSQTVRYRGSPLLESFLKGAVV